jgi:hypothetical protein
VQYPKHPDFGEAADLRPVSLRKVWAEVETALGQDNWRKVVDREHRRLVRQIVHPLELCDVGEDVIVVKPTWRQHFDRYYGQAGGTLTVAKLRQWLDEPDARGLLPEVQNLVILTYAAMTNRRFTLHGGPATVSVDSIDDRCELAEEPLPSSADWEVARTRAAQMFGLDLPPLRNATTVGDAAEAIVREALAFRPPVLELARVLPDAQRRYDVDPSQSPRAKTLVGLMPLLERLERVHHRDVIPTLAQAVIATTAAAFGTCAKRSADVKAALDAVNWQPIEALRNLRDERKQRAEKLLEDLKQALTLDELAVPLAPKIKTIERDAIGLLIPPAPQPVPPSPQPGWKTVDSSTLSAVSPADAKRGLEKALGKTRDDSDVRVTISWTIEERENG